MSNTAKMWRTDITIGVVQYRHLRAKSLKGLMRQLEEWYRYISKDFDKPFIYYGERRNPNQ